MMHCGGFKTTRQELKQVETPPADGIWKPIPHFDMATLIVEQAQAHGYGIQKEEYGLSKNGQQLFGVVTFENNAENEKNKMVGFRHSHNKTLAVSLTAGFRVFVCDNLMFGGDIVLSHKHTTNFDIGQAVPALFTNLEHKYNILGAATDTLKATDLDRATARDLIVEAAARGAIASCDIMPVVQEYDKPSYASFEPRNKWSLYNAFTTVAKKFQPAKLDNCLRELALMFELGTLETV